MKYELDVWEIYGNTLKILWQDFDLTLILCHEDLQWSKASDYLEQEKQEKELTDKETAPPIETQNLFDWKVIARKCKNTCAVIAQYQSWETKK